MRDWREGIWIAISTILISIFLIFLNNTVSAVREYAKSEQENIDNVFTLRESLRIGRYDNTLVSQEEVINCIMENRDGTPDVIVDNKLSVDSSDAVLKLNLNVKFVWSSLNSYYMWDGSRVDTGLYQDYVQENLIDYIKYDYKYRSRLVKNANGEVMHIWFSRIS